MKKIKQFGDIPYYIANDKNRKGQPIILHIHGAGSRGSIETAIGANPVLRYAEAHADFPFKIYAPVCMKDTWFDLYEQLSAFIEYLRENEVSSDIFLCGISMGGYCSWQLLQSKPEFFKKAIICCGGGMYWNAGRIKTPVRAFHGRLDRSVFPEESEKMVNAVNACGGSAVLTFYDELSHNVWDTVFSDKENYKWLLK